MFSSGDTYQKRSLKSKKNTSWALIKKKIIISHMKKGKDYSTFVVGNAPLIPIEERFKSSSEQIVLIGLSGLRSLLLACQLGNKKHLPKIIIIDNSNLVIDFWRALRKFAENQETIGSFMQNLSNFLDNHAHLYRALGHINDVPGVTYPNQNIKIFFAYLFQEFGFEHVRKIIVATALIKQSWTNTETFRKLKNLLDLLGFKNIYMFPSNVIHCVNIYSNSPTKEIFQILSNIALMQPKLTIYSDLSPIHRKPVRIFFARDYDPEVVKKIIFPELSPPSPLMQTTDEEKIAEQMVKNIEFRIHSLPWRIKRFWREGWVMGEKPKYIKKQLDVIQKARLGQITFLRARNSLRDIGIEADNNDHVDRDPVFTKTFYHKFKMEDEFNQMFRM
jgi:hypothetical protein